MSLTLKERISTDDQKTIFENGVEFLGFVNKQGRLVDHIANGSVEIPRQKSEMLFMSAKLQNSLFEDFVEDFGPLSHSVIHQGESKFLTVPVSAGLLFSIIKSSQHEASTEKIFKTLNEYRDIY